jgi:mono/diheme cytochrome c family protein
VSRNDVILGVAALVLVVFSLVVSLVIPRRDPGFPGRNIRVFTVVAVLLVVAMLGAVEVFGEAHESEGGAEHTESGATDTGEQGDTGGGGGGGGDLAAGEEIFVANCGSCHTLEAAGTSGNVGPNLNDSSFDQGAVEEQVAQGGGGMPAFEGQLSEEEIQNVAAYVVANEDG